MRATFPENTRQRIASALSREFIAIQGTPNHLGQEKCLILLDILISLKMRFLHSPCIRRRKNFSNPAPRGTNGDNPAPRGTTCKPFSVVSVVSCS
jgi:hypothetical protein